MNRRGFLKALGLFTATAALPVGLIDKAVKALVPVQPATEFIEITFYGTGLEIVKANPGPFRMNSMVVDGLPIETKGVFENTAIATGLPYGFHVIKAKLPEITGVKILAPKMPEIPNGHTDLATYYLVSDYKGPFKGAAVRLTQDCGGEIVKSTNPVGNEEECIRLIAKPNINSTITFNDGIQISNKNMVI